MSYLLNRMIPTEDPESFRANQLTVITFNFDRSFERLLFLALKANYGLDDAATAAQAAHVPVQHVHGDLGGPAWMPTTITPDWRRPYNPTCTPEIVAAAVKRIRLVHEEVTDETLAPMWSALQAATRIYFIGCGFHIANMKRLRMNHLLRASIHATAKGCTPEELRPVQEFCKPNSLVLHPEYDAMQLVRNIELFN